MKEDEFRKLRDGIMENNPFCYTDLYTGYLRYMRKHLGKYMFDKDNMQYCIDLSFTKAVKDIRFGEFTQSDFNLCLYNNLRHEGFHLKRDTTEPKKVQFHNEMCSLYMKGETDNKYWIDTFSNHYNLEKEIIKKLTVERVYQILELSNAVKGKQCLLLQIQGYDYEGIANIVGINNPMGVGGHLTKIKKFIRERMVNYR